MIYQSKLTGLSLLSVQPAISPLPACVLPFVCDFPLPPQQISGIDIHTIAHAIEKETHYERYRHGEAVAIGMAGAADISVRLGLLAETECVRMKELIRAMGLPLSAKGVTADAMYEDLFHDKKTVGGRIHWVLAQAIGRVTVRSDVPEEIVRQTLLGLSS